MPETQKDTFLGPQKAAKQTTGYFTHLSNRVEYRDRAPPSPSKPTT